MSSTESEESVRLAGALFDAVVAPQAEAKRAGGARPYFPLQPDPKAESYFVVPDVKVMAPADFELPGGGEPNGLIDALVTYWSARGEAELAQSMTSHLKSVAAALSKEAAEDDGSVDILCYTLF